MRKIGWAGRLAGGVLGLTLVVGATMSPAPEVEAAEAPRAAVVAIDTLGSEAVAILRNQGLEPDARKAMLVDLVHRRFALQRIAQLALGRYWRTADAAERTRYVELFEHHVLRTYGRMVDFYTDQRLEVVGARLVKGGVVVSSRLTGKQPAAIDWRLFENGGEWMVIDVVVEGVSMLITQRNEFAAIIERNGGSILPLLAHLEQHVGQVAQSPG